MCWQFCGGVDFQKLIDEAFVSDKISASPASSTLSACTHGIFITHNVFIN